MKFTYILLFLSVALALFNRGRVFSYICIALTIWLAYDEKVINSSALAYLGGLTFLVLIYYHTKLEDSKADIPILIGISLLLAGFVLHHIPGFTTWLAIDHVKISAAMRFYAMPLNFDKVIAALLVYSLSTLIVDEKTIDKTAFTQSLLILIACILVILVPAILTDYIQFDPKIPGILPIWALNNFLFVCFSEEVIFRGFLQSTIQKYLPNKTKYAILSIILASIIFGLAHYKDGQIFMALAAICGLFYGYAYYKTGRVLCAMLVHFSLNLTHILFFTYP